MSAETILNECKALIAERGEKYGDFDHGMNEIACVMGLLNNCNKKYEGVEVSQFNFAQKILRMHRSQMKHRDTCIDAIAYLAEYIHLMDQAEGWQ